MNRELDLTNTRAVVVNVVLPYLLCMAFLGLMALGAYLVGPS